MEASSRMGVLQLEVTLSEDTVTIIVRSCDQHHYQAAHSLLLLTRVSCLPAKRSAYCLNDGLHDIKRG